MDKKFQPRIWTTKTYNRFASYYDILMKILFPIGEKARQKIVEIMSNGSILDVACGTGTLIKLADEKGLRCYGIDLSEGMLAKACEKAPKAEFVQASFYRIPYSENHFNHVVATNALSGTFIDSKKVLEEMLRVCMTGGWVYIAEWPKAPKDTFWERIVEVLASLNEDSPKDYHAIFKELGYQPKIFLLSKRFYIYGVRKHG